MTKYLRFGDIPESGKSKIWRGEECIGEEEDIEALKKLKRKIDASMEKPVEKPAEWSEEDEKMLRTIISDGSRGVELDSKQISWLKSLRPSWKPSEEQKPEVKLTGWVARDREFNPYLGYGVTLFNEKPSRHGNCWEGVIVSRLPWKLFPDLKWEDEPIEVELTIKKKNAEL